MLAYAVVESENYESWYWFFLLLKNDFDMTKSYHWSFMSNKQNVHNLYLFICSLRLEGFEHGC